MRAGIVVNVTRADRARLEAIVRDRGAPQKHVWRARIILATAEGCGTSEIMRRSGKAKPVVWRWQERFMKEGVDGLLRDKTRKPGKPPLPAAIVRKVIDLVTGPPPGETTHWTGRMLAKAAGISLRSVQRTSSTRCRFRSTPNGRGLPGHPGCYVFAASVLVGAVIISFVARNRAVSEQTGEIVGVNRIAQEKRLGYVENLLHGAQIR
jgi:hypothetical protein